MDSPNLNFIVDLSGQVALVAGGGSGLGRAYAVALALAGARVAVLSRSSEKLNETVRQIEEKGGWALAVPADVTDRDAIERSVGEVQSIAGPVDLLINSAAIGTPVGPIWEVDPGDWWRLMEINLYGQYLCIRAVLPGMIERCEGRIINMASAAGEAAIPYFSAYAISKTGLIRFSETLALETIEYGISVFAIGPGAVRTEAVQDFLPSKDVQHWLPWYVRIFEEGRDVGPELSVELVLRLASGMADRLSGCYIHVTDDIDEMLKRVKDIEDGRLYKLQMTELG